MATKPASEVNINDYYVGESIANIIESIRNHRDEPTRNEALDLLEIAVRALKVDGVIGYETTIDDVADVVLRLGDVPEEEMLIVADTRTHYRRTTDTRLRTTGVIERKKKPVLVETK